jgi:hypothetical protein
MEGDHLEDPGVDGRIIEIIYERSGGGGTDWIDLAQDREQVGRFL